MAQRKEPLWLRKSARQVVAQWTARTSPSKWAEDAEQRDHLIRWLCLELISAIAYRIPDRRIAQQLLDLHRQATGLEKSPDPEPTDAR